MREPGKLGKRAKMVPLKDHPGLYTFENIERDPEREKKVVDEIMEKAKAMAKNPCTREDLPRRKWWHIF